MEQASGIINSFMTGGGVRAFSAHLPQTLTLLWPSIVLFVSSSILSGEYRCPLLSGLC